MNSKRTFLLISIFLLLFFLIACIGQVNNFEKVPAMKSKNAVKYLYNVNPFYVHWKRHYCPECGTRLKTAYDSVIVNSNSPEAKDYDFSIAAGDSYLTGDVEFRTSYFKCPKCEFVISFDEMKKLEKTR